MGKKIYIFGMLETKTPTFLHANFRVLCELPFPETYLTPPSLCLLSDRQCHGNAVGGVHRDIRVPFPSEVGGVQGSPRNAHI